MDILREQQKLNKDTRDLNRFMLNGNWILDNLVFKIEDYDLTKKRVWFKHGCEVIINWEYPVGFVSSIGFPPTEEVGSFFSILKEITTFKLENDYLFIGNRNITRKCKRHGFSMYEIRD